MIDDSVSFNVHRYTLGILFAIIFDSRYFKGSLLSLNGVNAELIDSILTRRCAYKKSLLSMLPTLL